MPNLSGRECRTILEPPVYLLLSFKPVLIERPSMVGAASERTARAMQRRPNRHVKVSIPIVRAYAIALNSLAALLAGFMAKLGANLTD